MQLTHSTARHGAARHSTTQHSAPQHSTPQRSATRHGTPRHGTALHSTARRGTAQQSATSHSTARHNTPQQGTAGHGRAGHNVAQRGAARRGTARHSTAQHAKPQRMTAPRQGMVTVSLARSSCLLPRKERKHAHRRGTPAHEPTTHALTARHMKLHRPRNGVHHTPEGTTCIRTAHLWIGDRQQSGLRNSVVQLQELESRWPRPDRSRIAISSDEDRILDDSVSTDMLFVPILRFFAFPGQFDLLSID